MPQDSHREIVFVYGTLRRGGVNHTLLRTSRFLGSHRTTPRYTMLDLGGCPGVVRRGRTAILGELYEVTPAVFEAIDELEDYPRVYTRERIETPCGPAWMYLYRGRTASRPRVRSGDWLRYAAARADCPDGVAGAR